MLKKWVCLLLVFSIISVFGLTAFADPTGSPAATPTATPQASKANVLSDHVAGVLKEITKEAETDEFIIEITMPDQATVSITKKTYAISGVSQKDYSDVTVVLQVYDDKSGEYVPMENNDGESSWNVGKIGAFSKEINLKEGPNKIRILAFRESEKDDLKKDKVQANKYTITLQKEGMKDVIINTVVDFASDLSKYIFK